MKFSTLTLSLLFAGASAAHDSTMAEIRSNRRMTKDFMHAMREPAIAAARQKGRAEKIRKLHEDLISSSRKLANNYNQYQGQQNQNQNQYQNQYQQGNNQYNNNGQNQQANNGQYQQGNNGQYQQGNNQYQDDNQYNLYEDMAYWEEAPFDISSKEFKYSGCAAIKTYDEDRAYENGNPMILDTYAVFRLCPADKCNKYSLTGCGKNYGEYAVEMKTYLSYVLSYYEDRYDEYCEYCAPCDYEYEAEAKSALNQCYAQQQQQQYQNMQQQSQNNYNNQNQANQNANGANGNGNSAYNNGQGFSNYNQYYNGANNNVNYNGYANNNNANNNNNNNADNGERKLEANNNYNGNYYNGAENEGEQDADGQNNQAANNNAAAYGYYDENGDWVDGQGGAQAANGYWGQDGQFYPYDNDMNSGNNYECQDGTTCDFCTFQTEQTYLPCDDYICNDYYTYCSDLYGNNQQDQFNPMDYLECQQFQDENGNDYYIGPHCGSDHYTVSLGVFSDENCVEYIGEEVSIQSVLGFNYDEEDVFEIPKECISCDGAEEYEQQQDDEQQENQGRYGQYVASPTTTDDGIVAMCAALYSGSAQCNMNMNNFEQISRYMSSYELNQESRYCAFIENIVYGAYDESGEIILKPEQFDFADWQNPTQYKKLRMSVGQAVGLALSIILCVALLATAAITNRALTRQSTPWKPKRVSDNALARQNSGIVMGRSRSGPGAAPLI